MRKFGFFYNEITKRSVLDAGVIHLPDNLSDHCPIFCTVDVQSIEFDKSSKLKAEYKPKPSWKRASEEEKGNYKRRLEDQLSSLHVPESLYCMNVKCQDTNHCNDIDDFITDILEFVQSSATDSLPSPVPPRSTPSSSQRHVPGWNNFVKPFRDNAYFWDQVWSSAGRPMNTELHRIMKRTRNLYHYHYRKCRKSEDKIARNKLLDACLNGQGDIFKEIKKLRASKPIVATSMDGVKDDIFRHFKTIYSTLYNSVDDQEELMNVAQETESRINSLSNLDVEKVTPDVVKEAASHLRDSKSDPTYSFNSDCIKNGSDKLFENLSLAVRSFLVHGHVTYFLLLATLAPIIKDKLGSINSSKNYRSIADSEATGLDHPHPLWRSSWT